MSGQTYNAMEVSERIKTLLAEIDAVIYADKLLKIKEELRELSTHIVVPDAKSTATDTSSKSNTCKTPKKPSRKAEQVDVDVEVEVDANNVSTGGADTCADAGANECVNPVEAVASPVAHAAPKEVRDVRAALEAFQRKMDEMAA